MEGGRNLMLATNVQPHLALKSYFMNEIDILHSRVPIQGRF